MKNQNNDNHKDVNYQSNNKEKWKPEKRISNVPNTISKTIETQRRAYKQPGYKQPGLFKMPLTQIRLEQLQLVILQDSSLLPPPNLPNLPGFV